MLLFILLRIPASQTLLLCCIYSKCLTVCTQPSSLHLYLTPFQTFSLNVFTSFDGFKKGCRGRPSVFSQLWSEAGRFRAANFSFNSRHQVLGSVRDRKFICRVPYLGLTYLYSQSHEADFTHVITVLKVFFNNKQSIYLSILCVTEQRVPENMRCGQCVPLSCV